MFLKNTSRYATATVRELLAHASDGFDLRSVAVNVKNCSGAYGGMAYPKVPRMANVAASARYLVTVRIGAPSKFPCDNQITTTRWVDEPMTIFPIHGFVENILGIAYDSPEYKAWWREHRIWTCHRGGVQINRVQRRVVKRGPYGGKGSPLIVKQDWREGLVALAAHEFCHVHQFQNSLPRSEVHAEQAAERRLIAYRETL